VNTGEATLLGGAVGVVPLVTLALAAVLIANLTTYRMVRYVVTVVHEAGHAVLALAVGRKLAGIRLHSDTSGLTVSRGRPGGPGMVAVLLAGYPAPSVFGLIGAVLLERGYVVGMLWFAVVASALMLLQIRNVHGLLVMLLLGGALAGASWWLSEELLSWIAHLLVWLVLLAAPRSVLELARLRPRGRARGSDVDQLAALTHVHGLLWIGVFLLVALACLAAGGWLILAG
jgi:hypothetical protein